MGIHKSLKLWFGHGTLVASQFLAISEQDQGGKALDLQSIANGWVGVCLELAHHQTTRIFSSQPLHHWSHQPAGTAPFGPDIHQYGRRTIGHLSLEIGIGEMSDRHDSSP